MSNPEIDADRVLIRCLDVAARLTDEVASITTVDKRGILLETMLGRYVLDSDAREVWLRIDGRTSVREIAEAVANSSHLPVDEVAPVVATFCARLVDLSLVEDAMVPSSVSASA